jgi:hypothetical protein
MKFNLNQYLDTLTHSPHEHFFHNVLYIFLSLFLRHKTYFPPLFCFLLLNYYVRLSIVATKYYELLHNEECYRSVELNEKTYLNRFK